ncbi:hypothetical protein J4207_01570 [Candidatus Woesearchaeota archaeon]|nr:hypothetical protein [Candidatus Woesearchaeota archaeon]
MEFWNSALTEKSWTVLQDLKKEQFRFVVIGGWAAYLWTKQHKSRDIDVVLPDIKDLGFLKQKYTLNKNDNLKKYEIKFDEIDVDIYVPHFSKLTLPVEEIMLHTGKVEGFEVVLPEILLILKQGAELDRQYSIKGQKDRIDIMTLLCFSRLNLNEYHKLLKKYNLDNFWQRLKQIITTFEDVRHLNLTVHHYSKIKKQLLQRLK